MLIFFCAVKISPVFFIDKGQQNGRKKTTFLSISGSQSCNDISESFIISGNKAISDLAACYQ